MNMRIPTYTGKLIDLNNIRIHQIDILDIATSLSNQCRFIGHTLDFYSVAEHCLLGSHIIGKGIAIGPNESLKAFQLAFLMHDAAETYISDLSGPIKINHPSFIEMENKIMAIICERFGLPDVDEAVIDHIDMAMLAMEKQKVMLHDIDWGWDLPPAAEIAPMFLPPEDAKKEFIKRFKELSYE